MVYYTIPKIKRELKQTFNYELRFDYYTIPKIKKLKIKSKAGALLSGFLIAVFNFLLSKIEVNIYRYGHFHIDYEKFDIFFRVAVGFEFKCVFAFRKRIAVGIRNGVAVF